MEMEIDITQFVRTAETCELSASVAELGADAGRITWDNAKREAFTTQLLADTEALAAFRAWVQGFGAWSKDEIAAWDQVECNALLIQYISGDLRELESLCYSDDDEFCIDWESVEWLASEGAIGGNIFKTDDGRVLFHMGS